MAPIYNYKCNYCSREWEEVLPEEQKLAPTKVMQPEECDIFVAPHAGLAKCDVELVGIHTNTSQSDTLQVKSPHSCKIHLNTLVCFGLSIFANIHNLLRILQLIKL